MTYDPQQNYYPASGGQPQQSYQPTYQQQPQYQPDQGQGGMHTGPNATQAYPATGQFGTEALGSNFPSTGPTPVPKGKSPLTMVLAVVAVLLLAGTAIFGVLYFNERGAHKDDQSAAQSELSSTQSDLSKAQGDLKTAQSDLSSTKSELETTKSQLAQANQEKTASSKDTACAAAARKVLVAVAASDDAASKTAISEMVSVC